MDCRNAVYSNDYYDIMVSGLDTISGIETICKQEIADRYEVYYLNRQEVPPLSVGEMCIRDSSSRLVECEKCDK